MILPALVLAVAGPDCENMVTTADMVECADIDYREADTALNNQWKITLAAVRASDKGRAGEAGWGSREKRLLEAQRAWLTYRDAHCSSLYPYSTAFQLDYVMHVHCLTDLTEKRTGELAEITVEPMRETE